jgi:serine/threonine-protein kinase
MHTAADVVAGTPAFMPPEAALGQPIDGRADVYGIGCVAYWLLSGRLVFEAATSYQVLAHHIEDRPEPPSRRSETPIPPELDALVLACLEKDPARRPDAAALSRRLRAYAAREPWSEEQAREWWQAHLPIARFPQWTADAAAAATFAATA